MDSFTDNVPIPTVLQVLTTLLERPESFVSGSEDIQRAALAAVKFLFDSSVDTESQSKPHIEELLSSLRPSHAPRTRSQTKNAANKKVDEKQENVVIMKETPLKSLFTQDMGVDQIWAQIDLRAKNICDVLQYILEGENSETDEDMDTQTRQADEIERLETLESEDGLESESEDEDEYNEEFEGDDEEGAHENELGESTTGLRDPSSDEDDEDGFSASSSQMDDMDSTRRNPSRQKKKSELDDGFFSLSEFNAEVEEAERAGPSGRKLNQHLDAERSESDEESVDLFANVDVTENFDEEDLEGDGGELRYKDFFDPPARRPPSNKKQHDRPSKVAGRVRFHDEVKVKEIRAKGKNLPLYVMQALYDENEDDDEDNNNVDEGQDADEDDEDGDGDEDDHDDTDEEMDLDEDGTYEKTGPVSRKSRGIKRGRTHSESEDSEDEDESQQGGEGNEIIERLKNDLFATDDAYQIDLSTHERRMADIREQISQLEAENVGPKDWVLMGEASSKGRPQNSLLEEDLEFERVMKAVPVITEKTVQDLEERIKARILENRFDDVVRIRPFNDKPFLPSRLFELQDTKSTQSLAQIYEGEYTGLQIGGIAGDDRDGKLKKEHEEIEKLWETICSKLDAVCNAHFVPKQPKATISTIANIPAATLESALPTTKAASSMLAPEEIFTPASSDLRARSELTPTEKRALHNKERKSRKKQHDVLDRSVDKFARKVKGIGGVKREKQAALKSIVKSGKGVTIVGKKSKDMGKGKG